MSRSTKPLILVSACALVNEKERVLLAQRPEGKPMSGLWEFPGGKVEDGETPEETLRRELEEELGIRIDLTSLQPLAFASHAYESFHLLMPLFLCRQWEGQPRPLEGQALQWIAPCGMRACPVPPADVPLVAILEDFFRKTA